MDSSPGAMDLRERSAGQSQLQGGHAGDEDAAERPQERCRPGEGRAGLGVWWQEQGPRPAAPAKDPSRLEEDWGRGAEWRERGEWICGGREGGGRVLRSFYIMGWR